MAIRKKIIVANWKMNPATSKEANDLFVKTKNVVTKSKGLTVVVCPPNIFINEIAKKIKGGRLFLGTQDLHWEKGVGAFTGEVSADMLVSSGVTYAIVGHSERRELGDTNETINKKLSSALRAGLVVILCIGEKERDIDGAHLDFLKTQITVALAKIPRKYFLNLVVAYEPLWAIGENATGADSPASVYELSIYIRKVLAEIIGRDMALSMPILYGGSVDEKNAREFMTHGGVQGLLVGRASLKPERFNAIIKASV